MDIVYEVTLYSRPTPVYTKPTPMQNKPAKKKPIKTGKFEVFKDKAGEYRFRLKAPNGEIIATSEGYNSKTSCMNGIQSVMKNAPKAKIVEINK
jgi:uncharacterized protein YegP (UPF0339 family)